MNDRIDIEARLIGIDKIMAQFSRLEALGKNMALMESKGIKLGPAIEEIRANLADAGSGPIKAFNNGLTIGSDKAEEMANRFNMAFLSIMFGGMYLERWGKTMTSLVLPAMGRFSDFQHKGVKAVNAMNASLEFLKFSIFDAFSQTDLFKFFISSVIKIADWISDFVGKSPGWATAIGLVGIALTGIGTALILSAEVYTGIRALKDIANFFGVGAGAKAAANVTNFSTALAGLGGVILAAYSIKLSYDILKDDQTSLKTRIGLMVAASLGGALIGFAVGGPAGAGIGFAIGFTVAAIVNIADVMLESTAKEQDAREVLGLPKLNLAQRFTKAITGEDKGLIAAAESKTRYQQLQEQLLLTAEAQAKVEEESSMFYKVANAQVNPELALSKTYWDDVKIAMENFKVALEGFKPKPIIVYVDYVERNKPSSVKGLTSPGQISADKYTNSTTPAPKPIFSEPQSTRTKPNFFELAAGASGR